MKLYDCDLATPSCKALNYALDAVPPWFGCGLDVTSSKVSVAAIASVMSELESTLH